MRFLRVCLVMSAFGFLLMSPEWIAGESDYGWKAADDSNYMAHATALAYGRFPDYSRENAPWGPANHSIGPSLLAVPFVFAFSLADRFTGNSIVQARTIENIPGSWTGFGFVVASQVYFLIGIAMLLAVCVDLFPRAPAGFVVALSVAASGLPFYAFRRPVFTPAYEFFLVAAGIYLLSSALKRRPFTRRPVLFRLLSFAVAALLFLVRYNDIVFSLVLLAVLDEAAHDQPETPRFLSLSKAVLVEWTALALVVAMTALFVMWLKTLGQGLWNPDVLIERLFRFREPKFYLHSLAHLLIGIDWGLIFSAPLILLGLRGVFLIGPERRYFLPLFAALGVNFLIAISWGTQGSSYGHRYFVNAALPLATLGLVAWLERGRGAARTRRLKLMALSVFPICMLLAFENEPAFALKQGATPWGSGWVNNTYALNVMKSLFVDQRTFFDAAFGYGGFSYFQGAWSRGGTGYGPATGAKLAISWFLPIAFGASAVILERRRRKNMMGGIPK